MNHADLREFLAIGLAGICALAYCAWTHHLITLAIKVRNDKDRK